MALTFAFAFAFAPSCAPVSERHDEGASSMFENQRSFAHAAAVGELARTMLADEWSTGLAVGLLEGSSLETYGFGRRSGDGSPPDEDTAFEIGSLSKVFTSLLLAEAVTQNDLTLDEPVNGLLPSSAQLPAREGREVTLRHLSTHGSGLPPLPPNLTIDSLDNPYAGYAAADLYVSLPMASLATTPGAAYAYSNWGAGLLGQVLADRAHASYGELVKTRIAGPLGLARTSVAWPSDNVAEPHDAGGRPVPLWDLDGLAGAGAVRSTTRDLLRFASANFDRPGEIGKALALAQQVHAEFPSIKLGLGWHVTGGVHWHNGQTGGFHSFMAIDLTKRHAVVVLSDTAALGTDALGFALLRVLGGEPPSLGLPPLVSVTEPVMESYVGTYRHPAIDFMVTREGSKLFIQPSGQPKFRGFPTSETSFDHRGLPVRIDFRRTDAGAVDALVLRQAGQGIVATRVN